MSAEPQASSRPSLAQRLLDHLERGTTDQAEGTLRVPVRDYADPQRWEREMERIFRRRPVVVALSAQLREPGDYRALSLADVPLLAVRQDDGGVRVLLNTCRHRGSLVCEPGPGRALRFTCPYHAWTYDRSGALVGVPGRKSFGELDLAGHGLVELPSAERAGFVFAVTTPGAGLDIDAWLGDYASVLETLGLADMHLYAEREVAGPNWKIAYDGYVDAYHLDKLHRRTLGKQYVGNVMATDAWGPHQRLAFPQRSLATLPGASETGSDAQESPQGHIGVVHTVFPHVSVAGGRGVPTLVSQLLPGPTPDRSRTLQIHLTPKPVESEDARRAMDAAVDFLLAVVRDEDYATGLGIQQALRSGANESFVFGRNEPCNQVFHRELARMLDEA